MGLAYDQIIANFNVEGAIGKVEPFGNGLINKSFRLHNKVTDAPDYLMQCVNDHVFPNIPALTANLEQVTTHLRNKNCNKNAKNTCVIPVLTSSGNLVYEAKDKSYWRLFVFLKGCRSYERAPNSRYVYQGARAFGTFVRDMSDFPADRLHVVIPDFHNLKARFEELRIAKPGAREARLTKCRGLLRSVELQYSRVREMMSHIDKGDFPIRITHNDTKFNNVLFKHNGEAACVVDLDTTMPGIVHYDFGDGLRTGVVSCAEDEEDLPKVMIDEEKLEAYCYGFLEPLKDLLNPLETQFLSSAAMYMALIMSVRFLADYLNDDRYYDIRYPEQNFVRVRCQLRLAELFYEKRGLIERLVSDVLDT